MKSPWVSRKRYETQVRGLLERVDRAENRARDLGAVGERARVREGQICHQLGSLIHKVNRFKDSSGNFNDPSWSALLEESKKANRMLFD